jgi:predicted TPR repeat methyltransferase
LARRLDGVDLSPAMLDKARGKSVYDNLEQSDLVTFMSAHGNSYDAILAAAALIHFGDLQSLFHAAGHCLREKGLFVFTLFPNEKGDADFAVAASDRLAQSGCYRHGTGYVERLAAANAFSVLELKPVLHERDQDGEPVAGLQGVLQSS